MLGPLQLPSSHGRQRPPGWHAMLNSHKIKRAIPIIALCLCSLLLLYPVRYRFYSPTNESKRGNLVHEHSDGLSPTGSQSTIVDDTVPELVVAKLKSENATWLSSLFPQWTEKVYVVDDPTAPLTVPKNKGRESMAYLTYIIDYYDRLPGLMLFLHAERWQWHNDDPDYDGYAILSKLQLPYLREEGYVSLRCVWILGCPTEIRPFDDLGSQEVQKTTARAYKQAFEELLPGVAVPTAVGVTCCAQFGVTRDTVRKRPKEDYISFRNWLLETELEDATSGRVFEYMWHIIFGKQAVHCPNAGECYCKLFGLCDLGCNEEKCDGRYILPEYATMPQGWPLIGWDQEPREFSGPL